MIAPIILAILAVLIILIVLTAMTVMAISAAKNTRESIADPTPILESPVETPTICKRTFTFQRGEDIVHDWQMTATDVCQSGSLIN